MALPVTSGREAVKALCRAGFRVVRQRGSHVRLEKRTEEGLIKLTVPLHKSLKKGTLRRIIMDAGLTVEEFNGLL
jgi:predicted RNA binding protein YcfA (HicA-like mRNA interferase family)